jgi:hypothetical protein
LQALNIADVLQAKKKVVVNYPTGPSGFFQRVIYESRLLKTILLDTDEYGDRRGLLQHYVPEYLEHLMSITKVFALMPAPEVCLQIIAGLRSLFSVISPLWK